MIGDRVCVHLNLTTGRYVIADKPKGKKRADATSVTLEDVTFKVYETQRQYSVRKSARFVHAYAMGRLVAIDAPEETSGLLQVTYNPFRAPTFHITGQERPVYTAGRVYFANKYGYIAPSSINQTGDANAH
jgi:hypothetical protein